jgi:hypothetical protein
MEEFNQKRNLNNSVVKQINQELTGERRGSEVLNALLGPDWNRDTILSLYRNVPFDDLLLKYRAVTSLLNCTKRGATQKTAAHANYSRSLRCRTGREIKESFWIGTYNFDIFIPSIWASPLSKPRMKGLVIEIDGPVHNYENKMNKDEERIDFLKRLEIGMLSVSNIDSTEGSAERLIQGTAHYFETDSRSRQRQMRAIYIATILCNLREIQKVKEQWGIKNETSY